MSSQGWFRDNMINQRAKRTAPSNKGRITPRRSKRHNQGGAKHGLTAQRPVFR